MPQKRVLSIGVDKESLSTVSLQLERDKHSIDAAPTPRSALTLLEEIRFDLVVLAHPYPNLDVRTFLDELRSADSASKKAKVLILATDAGHPDLRKLRERGLEIRTRNESLVGDLAHQALSGDPRVQLTVLVRLAADLPYGRSQRICQSENLSVSGLLVRTADTLPIGTPVRTELTLPNSKYPLKIAARVVRLTGPGEIPGIALHFEDLSERHRAQLEDFLARHERGGSDAAS